MNDGVLDPEMLADLRELHSSGLDVDGIASRFLSGGTAKVQALRPATDAGDLDAVASLTHNLAGGSATLGAVGLAKLCAHVQRCAVAGDLAAVGEALPDLEAEFARARTSLHAAFPGSTSSSQPT
jgi:HPt (histidine-containing phosphotransfer) domain-containing protein